MLLQIEKFRKNGPSEILFETEDFDESAPAIEISEDTRLRVSFVSNQMAHSVSGELNGIPLWIKDFGGKQCFFSSNVAEKDVTTFEKAFKELFSNLVGRQSLKLQCDEWRIDIDCFVEAKYQNWRRWFGSIFSEFPIIRNPTAFGASSQLPASLQKEATFVGRYDLLNEIKDCLNQIYINLQKPNYLHKKYIRAPADFGYTATPKDIIRKKEKGSVLWRRVPLNSHTLVRKGIKSFEPHKFNSRKVGEEFRTAENYHLFKVIVSAHTALTAQLHKIGSNASEIPSYSPRGSRRTGWQDANAKKEKLTQLLEELVASTAKIIESLRDLGVNNRQTLLQNNQRDPRFARLYNDTDLLEFLLMSTIQEIPSGNSWIASPDMSELFEYFCLAKLLVACKQEGFRIVERSPETPVPRFVRMSNRADNEHISILYDEEVPGAKEPETVRRGRPLICTLDNYPQHRWYRPDFQIAFSNQKHQAVAILDAKYSSFKKMWGDNVARTLSEKYSYNFSGNCKFGKPAFYIGVLCLPKDDEVSETKSKMAMESVFEGSLEAAFQTSGITTLSTLEDNPLEGTVNALLTKFRTMSQHGILDNVEEYVAPAISTTVPLDIGPKINPNRTKITFSDKDSTKHKAPSVTAEMAAQIKGMLARGDKDMDIQLWFSINSGRVSEIKSGSKFQAVQPLPSSELPPSGPYPSLASLYEEGIILKKK